MNDLNQKARRILHFRIHDSYDNFKKSKETKQISIADGYSEHFMYNCTKHQHIIEMTSKKKIEC